MISRKAIEAIKLIGGKAVVFNEDECFVVMTVDEFRKLNAKSVEGLTKQELVDRINNDIAAWKFSQEEKKNFETSLYEIRDDEDEGLRYEKA